MPVTVSPQPTPMPTLCLRRRQRGSAVLIGMSALLVWGCSTPPPRKDPPPPAPVLITPVPGPGVPTIPAVPVAPAASMPYSAAVAARFPDPPVRYDTPAFEPNHPGFTSNAELASLLRRLVGQGGAAGAQVQLLPLGSSQQGAPLEALLFTRLPDASPAALRREGRPTVLLVGQQHGDEPAGAEALIVVARELAQGRLQGLLDRINVLVLPRANPDGAQAQRRNTASGIDANRDHLLLATPEAQAQAQLVREYRPAVVVDAHEYPVIGRYLEKFGAVQRFDALVQHATTANLPEFITRAADEWFRRPLLASLAQQSLSAEWYHTTSADPADKKVAMGSAQPDTARNVNGLTNAVSLLIETRGAGLGRLHLKRRVHTQVTALSSVLASAANRSADLIKLRQFVDNEVSVMACFGEAIVEAAPTPSEYALTLLDPVTGADKVVAVNWDSSLQLRTIKARTRPCGYWLAAGEAETVRRLRSLGVLVQRIDDRGVVRGESWRELSRESSVPRGEGGVGEGGGLLRVQVEAVPALLDVGPSSWYVPLDQPLANLVIAALEPDAPTSYLSHGVVSAAADTARVLARPDVRMTAVP